MESIRHKFVLRYLFVLALGSFLLVTCNKLDDIENTEVIGADAQYALPLASARLSFLDVIDYLNVDSSITLESDGLIRLNYKGDVLTINSEQLFDNIPLYIDQVTDTNYVSEFPIPGSIDIDFIDFKTGEMALSFQNERNVPLTVDVYIEDLSKNGTTYQWSTTVEAGTDDDPSSQNTTVDLEGWKWDTSNDDLSIRYVAIDPDGNRQYLTKFFMVLTNLEYAYAEGYLGNDLYTLGEDTIDIDFFEDWAEGMIYFEDPKITFTAFNSFGFPVDAVFEKMSIRTLDGNLIPLESEFVTNGVYIDYPRLDEVGDTVITNFAFNKDNSNIREVLGAGPVAVEYDVDGEPNPEMNTSIQGFMLDISELRVQMEVEIPMYAAASKFEIRDTSDFNLEDYGNIDFAEFKLVAENELPLAADMQLYFLDSQNRVVDSLLNNVERIIEAAPVDSEGVVTGLGEKTSFVMVEGTKLDNILSAKKMVLYSSFSTTNDGTESVQVEAEQAVEVRVGVQLGLE